jgi:four helix bundle protein
MLSKQKTMDHNYKKYTELELWAEARKLVTTIYELTKLFPKEEQFGLINQMRRCAVSIPSNIAEGCGRNHKKDSLQFLFIARGSVFELETQLYLSNDLKFLESAQLKKSLNQLETVRKLLHGFIRYYNQT